MKKLLITGGTVFVSKYAASYFLREGYEVYVLNRNTRPQVKGVKLIEEDRHALGDKLKSFHFDAVLDINAYNAKDIYHLCSSLNAFGKYIMISSSAVYPEYEAQPFREESKMAENKVWMKYGTDKIEAEKALEKKVPDAYIIRPPYLYGPFNNVYREAFVFDCAMKSRHFYLPGDGEMKLQFLHVKDKTDVRNYFCFYDYEYVLDVSRQNKLLDETIPLEEGIRESFEWYEESEKDVRKKPYIEYIDSFLKQKKE